MKLGLLGKPVKVIKSLLTRNSKKEEGVKSLIGGDTSIPQKWKFKSPTFSSVGKALRARASGVFGGVSLNLSGNNLVKTGDKIRARMLCATAALKATVHTLPKIFAGNEGKNFAELIRKTTTDKLKISFPGSNTNTSRVTGFEVCEYINRNKHRPGHITQIFINYTKKEIKQLSDEWFDLVATPMSLAKCVSDCASFNSPEHMAYLALIGFDINNVDDWMPKVFEDRIRVEIHSYQVFSDNTLRITYEVPIPLCRSAAYKKKYKIIASDTNNFFKTGLVSIKIVIQFTFNKITNKYDKKSGTLITAFLHNLPYQNDDIQTLLGGGKNKYYFGGDRGTTKKYIKSIGTTGMPDLPGTGPILFRLLNNSVTKKGKGVEAKHPSGFIATHVFVPQPAGFPTSQSGPPTSPWQTQNKNKVDVEFVTTDQGNKQAIGTVYGPKTNNVNYNYSQRLTIQRKNGLI